MRENPPARPPEIYGARRRRLAPIALVAAFTIGIAATHAAPATAVEPSERVLTLYSPRLESLPYVHRSVTVPLAPDGREAPAQAGYILGFEEQVLVDSKDPKAKPLPITKMMVHHLVYHAPGRVD